MNYEEMWNTLKRNLEYRKSELEDHIEYEGGFNLTAIDLASRLKECKYHLDRLKEMEQRPEKYFNGWVTGR